MLGNGVGGRGWGEGGQFAKGEGGGGGEGGQFAKGEGGWGREDSLLGGLTIQPHPAWFATACQMQLHPLPMPSPCLLLGRFYFMRDVQ